MAAEGKEKEDLPEDLLEMFCKLPPWSLGRVPQQCTRNVCPDAGPAGARRASTFCFAFCFLPEASGRG